MQQNRLYHDLSYLWPIVSPPEEYAEEAGQIREILWEHLGPGRHSLLELGVGGGHLMSHLAPDFDATAVDLSSDMLALSQRLNPGVDHHLGDMRNIRLPTKFDVVLVHDSINYMLTEGDLRAAFETARAHLEPGGIFVAAPDWFKETFAGPSVLHWFRHNDALDVTFIEYIGTLDPHDSTVESIFFYVIKEGASLVVEQDRHRSGLFPRSTWFRILGDAGFTPEEIDYPPYEGGYGGIVILGIPN